MKMNIHKMKIKIKIHKLEMK